jgi:predicted GNAT family acetyltransferase
VRGQARRARAGDRRVVARWLDDFSVEALGAPARGGGHWVQRLDDPAWQLWLWEVDGVPVSVVNGRGTTPVSSRLGPVYTPPAHRGRGYASGLTAHVTAELLAAGHERVTLFTDETNATSNALYARVGFVDVAAHGSWLVTVGRD